MRDLVAACGLALATAGCGPAGEAARPAGARDASAPQVRPAAPAGPTASVVATPPSTGTLPASNRLDALARPDDTFDTLLARHGAGSLVRETLPGGEGSEVEGWVLFPGDPARRVEIFPDESGRHPRLLMAGPGSGWRRADGVRIGLDSLELERLNGGPFEFTGFDWDYGGLVMDWKGGRLATPDDAPVGPVKLCPPDARPDGYPMGDGEFLSSLPVVRRHPAIVCEVGVALGAD